MSAALAVVPDDGGLTASEQNVLTQAEAKIERGIKSFIEVGDALAQVRDQRLYREEFGTFEVYCHERWGLSRSRVYRLIDASGVTQMSPIGDKPTSEGQARELVGLEPKEVGEVMRKASETTGGKVTAKAIKEARQGGCAEASASVRAGKYPHLNSPTIGRNGTRLSQPDAKTLTLITSTLVGMSEGLCRIDILDKTVTPEQATELRPDINSSIKELKRIDVLLRDKETN